VCTTDINDNLQRAQTVLSEKATLPDKLNSVCVYYIYVYV